MQSVGLRVEMRGKSLDDVQGDLEGMWAKTEGAVEATTLGIKPS